jgi:hypothetical protein
MSVIAAVDAFAARLAHGLSRRILAVCIRVGRRLGQRRLARGRPRTLWGTTPIITLSLKARADEALGFRSESVVFTTYYITQAFTWNLRYVVKAFNAWASATPAGYRCLLGLALLRYDIFHYFADRGILQPNGRRFGIEAAELDAIRAAGKSVYVFAYGADVRTQLATRALGNWNFCRDCDTPGRYCICDDTVGAQLMAETAQRATALISLGDMLTYMPGAHHLAYWPIDTVAVQPGSPPNLDGPLRIAHAPNHTHFKGTAYLEASIARLSAQGHAIELVRISGVPNTEVMRLFANCDVVADQFIGGAYGYAALEALACAKPVITYVRSRDLVLAPDECPFLNVTPDDLDALLIWCCGHREALRVIGRQGRAYVERHHAIPAVAGRLAALYHATAGLPPPINDRLTAYVDQETLRQANVAPVHGWQHPWLVGWEHAHAG